MQIIQIGNGLQLKRADDGYWLVFDTNCLTRLETDSGIIGSNTLKWAERQFEVNAQAEQVSNKVDSNPRNSVLPVTRYVGSSGKEYHTEVEAQASYLVCKIAALAGGLRSTIEFRSLLNTFLHKHIAEIKDSVIADEIIKGRVIYPTEHEE